MNHLASLPWYDLPASREGLTLFWHSMRKVLCGHGRAVLPENLERQLPLTEQWSHPGLIISQCCGLDLFTPQAKLLKPLARPQFAGLDCSAGDYFSWIVTPEEPQQPTGRIVINAGSSHSGATALLQWLNKNQEFSKSQLLISGSHQMSIQYLRQGWADLAAIDAHSWSLMDTRGIRIIDRSVNAPAPPFVTSVYSSLAPELILDALKHAVDKVGEQVGIEGLLVTERDTYGEMEAAGRLLESYLHQSGITLPESLLDSRCSDPLSISPLPLSA